MISNLFYDVTFSNEKVIKQDLNFKSGSTLITGANGRGKSLNFEFIAFLLFGSKALRGVASDYKKIKSSMTVTIKGEKYVIKRTKSQSQVFHNGEQIVSGTSTVNPWVIRTLGYDYDVFRIAHWCAQGDIQALASMRPTERKQMIDDVAGLSSMDLLTKELNERLRLNKQELESFANLAAPEKPAKPSMTSKQIESAKAKLEKLRTTYYDAKSVTEPATPIEPEKPQEPAFPDAPVLNASEKFSKAAPEIPDGLPSSVSQLKLVVKGLEDEILKAKKVKGQLASLSHVPEQARELPVQYESPVALTKAWEAHRHYLKIQSLKDQSKVDCPKCGHEFHLSDQLEALLAEGEGLSEAPPMSESEYNDIGLEMSLVKKRDALSAELAQLNVDEVSDVLSKANTSLRELMAYEQEKTQFDSRNKHLKELFNSQQQSHLANVTRIKQHHAKQMQAYDTAFAKFEEAKSQLADKQKAYDGAQQTLAKLKEQYDDVSAFIRETHDKLVLAQSDLAVYNNEIQHFEKLQSQYDELKAREKELSTQRKDLEASRKAVKEVKERVQSHLLPSLNQVASSLMNEMTGGEYCSVVVGDSFEVEVDGQPLRTLSGSGKDLANLTLRIALGRIITHKVMGFMLLDEIDSAMDDTRAHYTWECIERITPQIGQVIQASHKDLHAKVKVTV